MNMNLGNFNMKNVLNSGKILFEHNKSKVLLSLGLASFAIAILDAVKQTPKAMDILKEEEEKKGDKLTATEAVKATWKEYIVPAAAFTVGVVAVSEAVKTEHKEVLALSAAVDALSTQLSGKLETKDKVETKDDKDNHIVTVYDASDAKEDNNTKSVVVIPDASEMWFYESLSGRPIKTTYNAIRSSVCDFRQQFAIGNEPDLRVNEWFQWLGLDVLDAFDDKVWTSGMDVIMREIKMVNDIPMIVIDYAEPPKTDLYYC